MESSEGTNYLTPFLRNALSGLSGTFDRLMPNLSEFYSRPCNLFFLNKKQ